MANARAWTGRRRQAWQRAGHTLSKHKWRRQPLPCHNLLLSLLSQALWVVAFILCRLSQNSGETPVPAKTSHDCGAALPYSTAPSYSDATQRWQHACTATLISAALAGWRVYLRAKHNAPRNALAGVSGAAPAPIARGRHVVGCGQRRNAPSAWHVLNLSTASPHQAGTRLRNAGSITQTLLINHQP